MKIVIATPLYPPEIGGPATYAKLLAEELPAQGIDVELVKFSDVRHFPKLFRHYAYYRRILQALRTADLVLALDAVSVGLPAMMATHKLKRPLVLKVGGDYAWEQGQQRFGIVQTLDDFVRTDRVPLFVRALRKIQSSVARSASCVIAPSNYLKSIIVTWGVSEDCITVIYNAVPKEKVGAVPPLVTALPRPLVATVGRLVPWKQVGGVIDAIATVRGRGVKASLVVVGDGPEYDRLLRYAERTLRNGYVFTGALSHADALAVMEGSEALVLNSSYEGLSHLLIEACVHGVPTIATRVGGNEEVIMHEKDGLLVQNGDAGALATSLERLLSDTRLSAHMSAHAQESARVFSVDTMVTQTARLLTSLV